jgi:hypothetical protein
MTDKLSPTVTDAEFVANEATRIVAENIDNWGWGPLEGIDGLAEHQLAIDAAGAGYRAAMHSLSASGDVERAATGILHARFSTCDERIAEWREANNSIWKTAMRDARAALTASGNGGAVSDDLRPPIMLEMSAASAEQEMWERRFAVLYRSHPSWRSADNDGSWGLRDFLRYVGQICGFDPVVLNEGERS